MQRYLAEEVAEDLADGIITPKGGDTPPGPAGRDRCRGDRAAGHVRGAARRQRPARRLAAGQDGRRAASETTWAPVARESITFAGPRVPLMAAWAAAAKPRGARARHP